MPTRWRTHWGALAMLSAAILLLYRHDATDLAFIWWNNSTFGHCLVILPLLGWLVHIRWPVLRALTPRVWWAGLLWLGLGNALWLLGDAASLGVARHAGLVLMVQGAVAALLGREAVRVLLFPLGYALFLIPLGSEIVPPLQLVTARLASLMLDWTGVPAYIEGIFITTPVGYFEVAEACAGAKFVIAMAAYAVLLGHLCFRDWWRRIGFFVAAIGLSVVANGLRAFATIFVAQTRGVDSALGFDHVVYGGVFFALVMALVTAAAWPFFDRSPLDGPAVGGTPEIDNAGMAPGRAAGFALLIALLAPLWSLAATTRSASLPAMLSAPAVAGWQRSDAPMLAAWTPRFDGADRFGQWRYRDTNGRTVDLAIALYARQEEGRELIGYGQGAAGLESDWVWSAPAPAPGYARGERITAPGPVERHVVSAYRVGTQPFTGSAAQVKWQTLRARLLLDDQRAVAILVSAEQTPRQNADRAIRDFLAASGPPDLVADAAERTR